MPRKPGCRPVWTSRRAPAGSTPTCARALLASSRCPRWRRCAVCSAVPESSSIAAPQGFATGERMKAFFPVLAAAAVAALAATPARAQNVDDLLKKHACLSCHAVDKKLVGPSYKEVAAKYRGQAGAEKTLAEKVKKGGVGTWGQIPMPPNAAVSDADLNAMVKWILSQK